MCVEYDSNDVVVESDHRIFTRTCTGHRTDASAPRAALSQLRSLAPAEYLSSPSHTTMDEIVPRLWIGNLPSALDVESLKAKKIFSVVTAMRGRITINAVRPTPFQDMPRTDISHPTARRSTSTTSTSMTAKTKTYSSTFCPRYLSSKRNSTRAAACSCTVRQA